MGRFEFVMLLREFTEPLTQLLAKYANIHIDPLWTDVAVGASLLLFLMLGVKSSYLWFRRTFFNDIRALPEDQLAMVNIIAQDVNGIKRDLHEVQESLRASIATQLDKVVDQIKVSYNDNEPTPQQPAPPINQSTLTPTGTKLRKLVALRVRDAVMEKFVEGGWFKEDQKTRHLYVFNRRSTTKHQIEIDLETPYRDPSLKGKYTLHVWLDGKKKLNLEWSKGAEPNLRFLNAGDWVDVVTNWKFAGPKKATPVADAAE